MNYYDILLAKKLEDDRDPKVEGLSVTANGTYSEEGKVYKPVVVNVAGYSLEDIPSGAIASFSDGAALPLNKLKVSIDPVQSGSGDPSPTNIRPITGYTECVVTVADDTTTPTVEQTYTIPFTDGQGQSVTVYGGTIDVINGGGVNNMQFTTLDTLSGWDMLSDSLGNYFRARKPTGIKQIPTGSVANMICSKYKNVASTDVLDGCIAEGGGNSNYMYVRDSNYNTIETFTASLSEVQLVYELATPTTFNTQPTSIKSIEGVNNIIANTGEIIEGQYFKTL